MKTISSYLRLGGSVGQLMMGGLDANRLAGLDFLANVHCRILAATHLDGKEIREGDTVSDE